MDRIIEKNIPKNVNGYSYFVYLWTIIETGLVYCGYHLGIPLKDGYYQSSEDEEFLEDLLNPDNKIYFEIVKKGTVWDMFDLENRMLEEVDAKNPENEYYNNTNGGSRYTSQSAKQEAMVDDFIYKFTNR